MTQASTHLHRVRVHGGEDATRTRQRLGSLLQGAELRPPGLPPAAVLCVRRVLDPLPGMLALDTGEARPPPEWERAFVAALERALRSAARPAREAVPAAAEAVLFADRAELLACLARDALAGTAWLHWWWRDLHVTPAGGRDRVVAAWLETPEHVPAALEQLAASGDAVTFVAALARADATELLLRVAAAHGLPELRRAVAVPARAATTAPRARSAREVPRPAPPWRAVVPESAAPMLAPHAELLLGVALALRRAPRIARSEAFAGATHEWLVSPPSRTPVRRVEPLRELRGGDPTATTDGLLERRAAPRRGTRVAAAMQPPIRHARAAQAKAARTKPGPPPATEEHTNPSHRRAVVAEPSAPNRDVAPPVPERRRRRAVATPPSAAPTRIRLAPRAKASTPAARPRSTRPSAGLHADVADAPTAATPLPERVVETELGGVFYLLNLALFLELYGDFTRPLEPGIALDPWDLLALLAPRLLAEPARGDALWPLLARLAGRGPRERPGKGFRPPRVWRTPARWLTPFDNGGTWRWSAARGTLRVVHPAGFPVVAVPRTHEPPRAQLARELRTLRPTVRRSALPPEPTQPLARWVARLASYADARLHRANLSPDAMLRSRARVFVTSTSVDVAFRLAELPLDVRYAGLDRTPGWIPAAGRFVAFHFE